MPRKLFTRMAGACGERGVNAEGLPSRPALTNCAVAGTDALIWGEIVHGVRCAQTRTGFEKSPTFNEWG